MAKEQVFTVTSTLISTRPAAAERLAVEARRLMIEGRARPRQWRFHLSIRRSRQGIAHVVSPRSSRFGRPAVCATATPAPCGVRSALEWGSGLGESTCRNANDGAGTAEAMRRQFEGDWDGRVCQGHDLALIAHGAQGE